MNEYTFSHGDEWDGDYPDHLTISLDKRAALDTIQRLAVHLKGDAPFEVSFVGELVHKRTQRHDDRDRIAEAINRLQPDGMNPNEDVITYLRAVKLMIWDETMEPEEALKLAESQMPKGTDT
jgi:hypothetical protein